MHFEKSALAISIQRYFHRVAIVIPIQKYSIHIANTSIAILPISVHSQLFYSLRATFTKLVYADVFLCSVMVLLLFTRRLFAIPSSWKNATLALFEMQDPYHTENSPLTVLKLSSPYILLLRRVMTVLWWLQYWASRSQCFFILAEILTCE